MKKAFIALSLIILLAGCSEYEEFKYNTVSIKANDAIISAQVADTNEKITRGLMYREELGENESMIFVFADEIERTFWMKNTYIPLDIIFMDSGFNVINIQQAEPCEEDPCQTYPSEGPTMYVLEVNKGYSEKHGIEEGTKVEIMN